MSGHSKWATTKHKKAMVDARRGKLFAKLIKNIEVAARVGGGDPEGNPTLYDAIQKAKKSSVPNDNIDRAVKRGSGAESGAAEYQTIIYEGYGPNGVAMLVECLTDNRNRAASEVRNAITRNGGSMADPGSVSYLFSRKGVVVVPREQGDREISEDELLEVVLDAGAEEIEDLGEAFEVRSEASDLVDVRTAVQNAGLDYDSAESSWVPSVTVELDESSARQIFRLVEALEDSDEKLGKQAVLELMAAVDSFIPTPERPKDRPFLMPIEDVFSISGRGTVVTGRVERGVVKVGEEIEIIGLHDTKKSTVTGVEMFRKLLDQGEAGDNIGALLRGVGREDVERGQVLAKPGSITPHTKFKAEAYILTKEEGGRHTPFFANYRPQFYFRTTDVTGVIALPEGVEMVMPGDNVAMEVELIAPIAMDEGLRFAIREGGRTVGAGVVASIIE